MVHLHPCGDTAGPNLCVRDVSLTSQSEHFTYKYTFILFFGDNYFSLKNESSLFLIDQPCNTSLTFLF